MVQFAAEQYIRDAEEVVQKMVGPTSPLHDRFASEGRLGGYLGVCRPTGIPQLVVSIGRPLEAKCVDYFWFCQEKVYRLATHPEHRLSRESADPAHDKFPGGVRGISILVGFSALPADVDEIISGVLLCRWNELPRDELHGLLTTNSYAQRLGKDFINSLL